ncbi:MAG: hypothetical protein ACI4LX_09700 [Treponema sp.]
MKDEVIEWRDAWKKLISTSRKAVLTNNIYCFDELTTLQDDKMLLFEKAIALECMNKKEEAKDLYAKASDEINGLPVQHWRKRAKYFLDRLSRGGFMTTDLNIVLPLFNIQWDVYFNIHYYANLDDYTRYLAISSVSRIASEPAMAIVIFRTCLEIGLWTYFRKYVDPINEDYKRKNYPNTWDIGLNDLLTEMHDKKLFKSSEYKAYDKIRRFGNEAAHPGTLNESSKPFHYKDEDLKEILDYFNQTLRYLNNHAK